MTHSELKNKIILKFGTIAHFCEIADLKYSSYRRFLNRIQESPTAGEKARIKSMSDKCDKYQNPDGIGFPITSQERMAIFLKIQEKYGTELGFVRKHPDFSYGFVNNITSYNQHGNLKRSRKTKKVVELMKTLEL